MKTLKTLRRIKTALYRYVRSVARRLGYTIVPNDDMTAMMYHRWLMAGECGADPVDVLVFSRSAAKCDRLLLSMRHVTGTGRVVVMYESGDLNAEYDELKRFHPCVVWYRYSLKFRLASYMAVRDILTSPRVLVLTDDMVFTRPVDMVTDLMGMDRGDVTCLLWSDERDNAPLGLNGYVYSRADFKAMCDGLWYDSPKSLEREMGRLIELYGGSQVILFDTPPCVEDKELRDGND